MAPSVQANTSNRRRRAGALVLLVCLALVAACGDGDSAGAAAPLNPAPPLVVGAAQQRPARVVLPDDYDVRRRYPLVILLHGYGADADVQDLIFHLEAHATVDHFVLVLPNGTQGVQGKRFWNATPECCDFGKTGVDDVGYLAALMREAMTTYAVDPKRIRLVGHSNGGYMAYRYACEHPVPVDRVVVLAGSTYLNADQCRSPKPLDVLHIHGTADDLVSYEPNLPPNGDARGLTTIGAEAAVGRWAHVDGCGGAPEPSGRKDYHRRLALGDDPAETEILRYPNCRSGRSVQLWRSVGAGHVFGSVNAAWRDDVAAYLAE